MRTIILDRFISWSKKDWYLHVLCLKLRPYEIHMPVRTELVESPQQLAFEFDTEV